ncbi:hypothetical protein BX616_010929 [Lobosporangium transversale]|nr:hypothetical protein BX616_010929 [Lobosporangium transversale]
MDFPGWESVGQVALYINSLGNMMNEDDKVMLHTLIPEAAAQELFFSLRGRYRPIITTIEDIITTGSPSYWKEAIEGRVRSLVNYPKQLHMPGDICSAIKRTIDKVAKDPIRFGDAVELKHVLKQTIVYRASLGLPWSLQGEKPILVESAFGCLRNVATSTVFGKSFYTVIDEPFIFQAAYNFIKHEDYDFYYQDLQGRQPEERIFELHAPLDLVYAFHNKQLKQELFSIPKAAKHQPTPKLKSPIPEFEPVAFLRHLFKHKATIVGWEDYDWRVRYMEALTMGDFLEAHYKHSSMWGGSAVPPFYYPESSLSGPDIVFVLRIDDQLYPVFVQTKLSQDISPGKVEEARLTIHESKLKHHLPNLASYCPGGKYFGLIYVHPMVVKTPRESWDDSLWRTEPDCGADGNQVLKDDDIPSMQLLMIIDRSNMQSLLPGGVVDFLDSV